MNIWFGIRVELVLHSAGMNQNCSLKVFVIIEPPISGEILNLLCGKKKTYRQPQNFHILCFYCKEAMKRNWTKLAAR